MKFWRVRTLASVIGLAFLLLLALVLYPHQGVPSQQDAVRYVLEDLKADSAFVGRDVLYSVFLASYSNATGQWTVVVKVTESPHSQCPRVLVRTYNLLPIRRGVDKIAAAYCSVGKPIAYAEEAISATRRDADVTSLVRSGASACGYSLPLLPEEVSFYCPDSDLIGLQQAVASFSSEARWAVEWRSQGGSLVLEVDSDGNIVSRGTIA